MDVHDLRLARMARMGVVLVAAGLAGCSALGQAQAPEQEAEARPAVVQADQGKPAGADATPVEPPAAEAITAPPPPQGPTAELKRLIEEREVTELRTTYNGSYGASLLFKADELDYYVALFRQQQFWRVYKTSSQAEAEQVYRRFVARTAELAEVDIRRIRLQAQQAHTEKLLSERSGELSALQSDLGRQREQAALIASSQRQAAQEAGQLAEQQKKARAELQRLQARIKELERQQAVLGGSSRSRK